MAGDGPAGGGPAGGGRRLGFARRRGGGADRESRDARETRRAALSIGWQIMLASAVLVLGIVVIAIVFILHQALPREQIEADRSPGAHIYVDSGDVLQALVILGVAAVVFAGAVSWVIARRAVRPLGEALRLQRQFVADASHELRTPLAVLDARLQVVERRRRGGTEVTAETLAELRSDSKALIDIVGDLLLAAGGDDPAVARAPAIDVGPVVREAAASLAILAGEAGVVVVVEDAGAGSADAASADAASADAASPHAASLHAASPGAAVSTGPTVAVPRTSLRRCVVALVDNAVAHSPRGGRVVVGFAVRGQRVVITVADAGRGIVGIAPERVFDRFAHASPGAPDPVDASLTSAPDPVDDSPASADTATATATATARPSFGIGLALVREVAVRHGGSVHVESTSAEGTVFRLELPLAR